MSSAFASTVPRFAEFKEPSGRILGPDTYKPNDPMNPNISVQEPSKKMFIFRSTTDQRQEMVSTRTADYVSPGSYQPKYTQRDPDTQPTRKSTVFASHAERFRRDAGIADAIDSNWKLSTDAKDWVQNRNGGGTFNKAERESGTLAKYSAATTHGEAPSLSEGTDASAIAKSSSPVAARTTATSLDFFFRELHSVRDMLKEEPQPLYDGRLPRRVPARPAPEAAPTPPPAPANSEEEAVDESARDIERYLGEAVWGPEGAPEAPSFRYVADAIRIHHNNLSDIQQLPAAISLLMPDLSSLRSLDLSYNQIKRLPPSIKLLDQLETIRLHANQLSDFNDLAYLMPLTQLHRLTLQANPFDQKDDYRLAVCGCLPQVTSFDSVFITPGERGNIADWVASHRGRVMLKALNEVLQST